MPVCSRFCLLTLVGASLAAVADDAPQKKSDWKPAVARKMALFGHRNWIVIADSAYPAQSKPGIETVVIGGEQLEAVEAVLELLARHKHVRPNIYLDAELPHVSEKDARGIGRYRASLRRLIGRRTTISLPHEEIINKLDSAAAKFNVLILKTDLTLPYTSVFLELDCGYWSDAAEKRLREAMKQPAPKD